MLFTYRLWYKKNTFGSQLNYCLIPFYPSVYDSDVFQKPEKKERKTKQHTTKTKQTLFQNLFHLLFFCLLLLQKKHIQQFPFGHFFNESRSEHFFCSNEWDGMGNSFNLHSFIHWLSSSPVANLIKPL